MAEPKRSGTIESIANSIYLQAFNRLGVPMVVAGTMYMITQVVTLDRRMHVVEQINFEQTARIVQTEARRDELISAIGNLRADISGLRSDNTALLRAITRLEGVTDRNNGNGGR